MSRRNANDTQRRQRIARHRARVGAAALAAPRGHGLSAFGVFLRLAGLGFTAALVLWAGRTALDFVAGQTALVRPGPRPLWDIHSAGRALTPDNIERWLLAYRLELRADELAARAAGPPRLRPFVVSPGEPALYIAYRLVNEGFIADAELFNLYLRVNGLDRYLEAGNFMLAGNMTLPEVAAALQASSYEEVLVTLPEGLRMEEIAERLEANFVIDRTRFLQAAARPREMTIFDDYAFLADLPAEANLEGFLFPDTYRFPVNADSAETVLARFLDNFDAKLGADGLARASASLAGRDAVILASIIEREAVLDEERPLIASVYYNRLNQRCGDQVRGPFLESDPTVQFPLGRETEGWWPPIQLADYERVDSPYNTFLYPGLPPGPIANPGLSSLQAALEPAYTVYCFFHTAGPGGGHAFARTYAEHQQNVVRYGSGS